MSANTTELLQSVKVKRKLLESFVYFQLLPKAIFRTIRQTRHFREWYKIPMNYVRLLELPLTLEMLEVEKQHKILDISSPKLLPLYLSVNGYNDLAISDVENYFVKDFEIYSQKFKISPEISVFDAQKIPYEDNSFDRVFSVSVLEHVPDEGDINIVKEVARVLKPGGKFVFTLPAYKVYLEEWLKKASFYWQSATDAKGAAFYQRRYDEKTIWQRFNNLGLQIKDVIYIAETPIEEPELDENGRLLHNVYYLKQLSPTKFLEKLFEKSKRRIPLLPYFAHRFYSQRHQYLTKDGNDPNIRQVALQLQKVADG